MPVTLQHTVLTAGYEEIFGGQSTITDVVDRLKRSTIEGILFILGRVTAALNATTDPNERWVSQLHISQRLFGPGAHHIWRRLVETRGPSFDRNRVVLFHERQVVNLFKIALIAMPIHRGDADLTSLGEAMLMLNDLLDRDIEDAAGRDDHLDVLELYVFASTMFHQHPDAVHELVRSYELYIDPDRALLNEPNAVDVPQWITRATGLDAKVLWRMIYVLFGYWFSLDLNEIADGAHVRDLSWFAGMSDVSDAESELYFRAVGRPVEDLQLAVKQQYSLSEPRYFDVVEFAKTPLVFVDRWVHCVSVSLLRAAAGPNIQYRLLDDRHFTADERQQFLDFRGRLYEDYVARLMRRTFANRLIDEDTLASVLSNQKHCDGVIDYGDEVVLIEVKSALVPLAASSGTDFIRYAEFMTQAIDRAATQLSETIRAIRSGACVTLGLRPDRITRYFPVLVTLHLPSTPLTYRERIERGLAEHDIMLLVKAGVSAPPQLFDVHDLELIETAAVSGRSLADLLQSKVDDPNYVALSFVNYCAVRQEPFVGQHNPYLAVRYEELAQEAVEYFRERGLPKG